MTTRFYQQKGMSLLELLLALAIGALLMTGISSAISQGLQAKTYAHNANEMAYSARFALSRIVAILRSANSAAVTGSTLTVTPVAAGPTVVYALNGTNLQETDNRTSPATVSVLASNVTAFNPGKLDNPPKPGNYGAMPLAASLTPSVVQVDLALAGGGQNISVSGFSRIGAP